MSHIAVLGAGLMGHGIAQVFLAAGHTVTLQDPDAETLASAPARIQDIFDLLEQTPAAPDHLTLEGELAAAINGADFVFEAAPERLDLKQGLFAKLLELTGDDVVLASNTSGLPIGQIGAKLNDASRLVGTHFWNPPHLVPLVEVIQAERTDPAVVTRTIDLLRDAGKTAVHVKKDVPGFIGNRLQHALKREAIAVVEAGVCDAETVDLVVKEGFGMRLAVMGPLENSDLVGLNLTLDIHRTLLADLDRSAEPQKLLEDKVAAGELGMKVGKGFREWTPDEAAEARRQFNEHLVTYARKRLKK